MIDFDKHFAFDATFRGSIARFVIILAILTAVWKDGLWEVNQG